MKYLIGDRGGDKHERSKRQVIRPARIGDGKGDILGERLFQRNSEMIKSRKEVVVKVPRDAIIVDNGEVDKEKKERQNDPYTDRMTFNFLKIVRFHCKMQPAHKRIVIETYFRL